MTPPPAHTAHWIAGLLYLLPVLILIVAVLWQRHNDRGEDAAGHDVIPPREEGGPPAAG